MHRLLGNVRRRRAGLGLVVVVVSGLVAPVATPRVVAESASPSPQPVAHDTPLTNTEAVVTAPPPGAPALVPTTEIASMRTAHAKTFATEQPGKYTSRVYAHPIHFKDAAGIWQDIDMTLVPQADGRLRSRAHSSAVSVAPTADDGQLARVDFDAHHSVAYGLAGASPVPVHVSGTLGSYASALPDVSLELRGYWAGLKEDLVLASKAAPDTYLFPLTLRGVTPHLEDGEVVYKDAEGKEWGRTPRGWMRDSWLPPAWEDPDRPRPQTFSEGVGYELVPHEGGTALKVTLDRAWLDDPARVYPVRVDPTTTFGANTDDTYVQTNDTTRNDTFSDLNVGTTSAGANKMRSFIHFDTWFLRGRAKGIGYTRIATHLFDYWGGSGHRPNSMYRVTQGWWGGNMATYPGANVWEEVARREVHASVHWEQWDNAGILDMVHNWNVSQWWEDHGIMLMAFDENDNSQYRHYHSANQPGAGPHLVTDWWGLPNTPDNLSPGDASHTSPPWLSARYTHSDEQTGGNLWFNVYNSGGAYLFQSPGHGVCHGCNASYQPSSLADGRYQWDVIASDAAGAGSPTSGRMWFTLDRPPNLPDQLSPATGVVGKAPPTLSARYNHVDPGNSSGQIVFKLMNAADTVLSEAYSSSVCKGCTATHTPTGLPDGLYKWQAVAYDGGGTGNPNAFSSATTPRTFRVDSVAPPAPDVSSSSHPFGDIWYSGRRFQASWPLPSDASGIAGYSVVVDQNPATTPSESVNHSDRTYSTPTDLSDGQHHAHVRAVDNAGNWSQPRHFGFKVDGSTPGAPSITVTGDPDTTTSYPDPAAWIPFDDLRFAWSGGNTASGTGGWSFHLDQQSSSTPDDTPEGTLNWQPFPNLTDGEHTLHVKQKNNAGTWGSSAHRTVRIDATPPLAPTVSSTTHAETNRWYSNANASAIWSAADLAPIDGYSWVLDQSPDTVPDEASEGTDTSASRSGLEDGVHYLHVRARNGAGLWGATTHFPIRVDAVVEASSISSSSHPSQTSWSVYDDVDLAWSAPAQSQSGVLGWSYSFNGTDPDCVSEGPSTTRSYADMPDGTYVFRLRALDGLERCSAVTSYTVNIDTSAPTIASTSSPTHPLEKAFYDNADAEVRWAASDTAPINGYSWAIDRTPNTTPDTVSEGMATVATTSGLSDGEWVFHLRARNATGTWGPAVHRTVRIDTTAPGSPPVTSSSHPSSTTWYRNDEPSFGFATVDDSEVDGYSYVLDQSPSTVPDTTSEGTTTTTQYTDLADGVHTFHVRARNRLGMWGEPSHYTVRIDTLNGAPTVTSPTHPDPSAWYSTGTPELQWSGTYPSGVVGWSYTLDQSPVTVPDTTSEGTGTTKGYAGLAAGTHYFHLVALTEAGPTEAAHFPVRVDTSAPPAPPVSSTTHPSTTTWYPNASGTASFATMDTAPVNGYSVVVDRSPDTTPATMASTTSATVDFTLPDDVNYLHVRARNAAGLWGPTTHFAVRVDTTAPDVPGVSSSTHPSQTTWYPNDDPSFDLTATDISGVAGFSYVLDDMAVTDPDTTSEGSETRIAFSDLPDKPQYLHVRVRNGAGLWSGTEHFEVRIDDTAPAAPTMSSPTHPSQTAWSMSADATVRFPAADTAPVDGYSWMVDQSPSTTPDDVSEGTDSFATVTPGEGIYYLHARVRNASGLWGRPSHYALKTDAVAAAPSLASSSHPDQTTWYPSRTVAMGWTASEESGIAGYAVSVTPNVASDPGTVVNASGTSTQLELVEDRVWVVNMRSKTNSGAWSLPTAYVLNVDADPPATPVASSTSHPDPSRWYPNNDADFVFSTSDISGIDGYSIVADQSATTEPDDMVDTRSTSHHVADLPDGAHTLHVKARNAAGVWSATRHIRILVDTTPPTVVTSWTSPDSADVGETVAMAADWDASASPVRGLFCKSEEFNGSTCSAGEWTPATPATGESPSVATYTTTANDVGQQTYYAIMCDEAGLCSEPRAGGFLVVPPGGEHDGDVVVAAGYTRGKRDELDYFPDKWRPNWEPKRWFYEEGFPAKAKGPVEAALNDWQGLTGNRVGLRFTLDKSRLAAHGWDSDDVEETCNDFKEGKYDHLPETSGLTPNADRHFPNVVAWKNISALGRVQHCIDSTGLDDGLIVGVVMILDEKPPDSTRWWYPADGELAQSHQYSIRAAAQHEAGHWFGFYGLYKDGHFNPSDEEVCGGTHETHSTMCSPLPPETHFMESLHHEDIRAFRKGYERGYWLVASDGGVFSFGDARFHGSMGCCPLNSPMVGMAEHPSHEGYYTVAADGGIFTFPPNNPRVKFYGSMGGTRLNKPIIGMAVHPTGLGYWLVAADGGIFTFPDKTSTVKFYGSTGGQHIGTTIVGMAPTPDGNGYWLVGANGRVFAFGDAVKKGDLVGKADTATVVGIAPTQSGGGYWIAEANGNVWNFGNAADWGDALGQYVHNRFVAISPTRSGRGYLLFGNWHPPGERPRTVIRRFGDAPYFGRVIGDINLPIVGGVSRGWDG